MLELLAMKSKQYFPVDLKKSNHIHNAGQKEVLIIVNDDNMTR